MLKEIRSIEPVESEQKVGFRASETKDVPNRSISLDIHKPVAPCLRFTGWTDSKRQMCVEG